MNEVTYSKAVHNNNIHVQYYTGTVGLQDTV